MKQQQHKNIFVSRHVICLMFLMLMSKAQAQQVMEWNFNTPGYTENWNRVDGSISAEDGALIFHPKKAGAHLTRGVTLDASKYRYMTFSVKNGDINGMAAVSFRSSGSPDPTRYGKIYFFQVSTMDKDFKTYTIDLSQMPDWSGNILALKVQIPFNPSIESTIAFDYIKMLSETENTVNPQSDVPVNPIDSIALTRIYGALNGPSWTGRANWMTPTCVSRWEGVTIDAYDIQGKVSALSLENSGLSDGDMCLSDMTALNSVNLAGNNLTDVTFLQDLSSLDTLHLEGNLLGTTQLIAMKGKMNPNGSVYTYAPQQALSIEITAAGMTVKGAGEETDNVYEWFNENNEKVYTSTGNPSFVPAAPGKYMVNVTNPRLPGLVLTSMVTSAGISTLNDPQTAISVYPNPATSYFIVRNAMGQELSIYSMSGSCMKKINIKSGAERVSVQGIPSGLYLLVVKSLDGTGEEHNYKLIIK